MSELIEGVNIKMSFKSEAQRRKFSELLKKGQITQAVYDGFHKDTPEGPLPERAKPAKKESKPRASKAWLAKVK